MVKNKTDLLSAKGAELTNENEAELVGKLSLLSLHAVCANAVMKPFHR